ncbi:MAG: extracellular solute-binding protein [Planctomycetota bacterium]
MVTRIAALLVVVVVLAAPFVLSAGTPRAASSDEDVPTVVVVTPHAEQLRTEFAEGFARWHQRVHGSPARAEMRQPGGTREIQNQLQAEYRAAIKAGLISPEGEAQQGAVSADLMFGGGTYEHNRLARPDAVRATLPGRDEPVELSVSVPAGFRPENLEEWFGEVAMAGTEPVYHPEQYWIGSALSSFGIVFNRPAMARLKPSEPDPNPKGFHDLASPIMIGEIALADPRLSGSIVTTMDSILGYYKARSMRGEGSGDWDEGWRVLRGMGANTRYFTGSSTKPPRDVAAGEAAAGLAIDFYGRAQAQAVLQPGETPGEGRVGYVDPVGAVYVDPDPISMLRGGPNPELARRFIAFVLSEEGQALWQFPAVTSERGASNPTLDGEPMGPRRYELRRMPIRPSMYEEYFDVFVDRVNLYELASDTKNPGWRAGVEMMLGAACIDAHETQRAAWVAIADARAAANPVAEVERLTDVFYSWPTPERIEAIWNERFGAGDVALPDDALLAWTEENYRRIRDTWRDGRVERRLRIVYTLAFEEIYERVIEEATGLGGGA